MDMFYISISHMGMDSYLNIGMDSYVRHLNLLIVQLFSPPAPLRSAPLQRNNSSFSLDSVK